jgi:outer membrane immunogenic protein
MWTFPMGASMKALGLGLVVALGLSGTASGQHANWQGFYIGVSGGWGGSNPSPQFQNNGLENIAEGPGAVNPGANPPTIWYDFNSCFGPLTSGFGGGTYSYCGDLGRASGGFIGGQIGYNLQSNAIVYGIEVDAFISNIAASGSSRWEYDFGGADFGDVTTSVKHAITAFGTLRGRVGHVWKSGILYVTGGLAWGHFDTTVSSYNFNNQSSDTQIARTTVNNSKWGWTAGVGGEFRLTQHVSFKAEYLFIDFGTTVANFLYDDGGPYNFRTQNQLHTFKGGLNMRFGTHAVDRGAVITK